tara:strand:+ start:98 stop:2134 length:2037 start_codon:yes stop_codon:yes gene_type:complete
MDRKLKTKSAEYKYEINGIRGLAILAVIFYHLNPSFLKNGYLGVDIFFVISGFVINLSLEKRLGEPFKKYITNFYTKRIKRLFPALLTFFIVNGFLIKILYNDPKIDFRTGLSSLFGISNLYLLRHSQDYFSPSNITNPFTHTWSLSLEFQFYLLIPLLIWFSTKENFKFPKLYIFFLIVLFSYSISIYIFLNSTENIGSYYLLVARAWQFLIGIIFYKLFQKKYFQLNQNLSFLSLIIIICLIINPIDLGIFSNIFISLFTSLLLISIKNKTITYNILTNRYLYNIGEKSYSLYLWHWGLISLFSVSVGINYLTLPILLLLIYLFGNYSYKYIENPIFSIKSFSLWNQNIIKFSSISIIISLLGIAAPQIVNRSKSDLENGENWKKIIDEAKFNGGLKTFFVRDNQNEKLNIGPLNNCTLKNWNFKNLPHDDCYLEGKSLNTIFFAGNSHSAHLRHLKLKLNQDIGFNIDSISLQTCIFPSNLGSEKHCKEKTQSKQAKRIIESSRSGDIVVISNRYPLFKKGPNKLWTNFPKAIIQLKDFVNALHTKNVKVILFAPTPEFYLDPEDCIPTWYRSINTVKNINGCSMSYTKMRNARKKVYKKLRELPQYVHIYDPLKKLCPNNKCNIIDFNKKKLLYTDGSHFADHLITNYIFDHFKEFLYKEVNIDLINPNNQNNY